MTQMAQWGQMFQSYDELFQATNELISVFEENGNPPAARELRNGMAALNGLTDGWALFLESVQNVKKRYVSQLSGAQQATLAAIYAAAYEAVYRRTPGPWWKLW